MEKLVLLTLLVVLIDSDIGEKLTEKENGVRLGSCGEPDATGLWLAKIYLRKKNAIPTTTTTTTTTTTVRPSTLETTTVSETTTCSNSTTTTTDDSISDESSAANETASLISESLQFASSPFSDDNEMEATGVFISQHHVLTTSSPFIYRDDTNKTWRWRVGGKRVNWKDCYWRKGEPFRLHLPPHPHNYVIRDARSQERSLKMAYLLDFCARQNDADEFLTLLLFKRPKTPLNAVQLVCLPKMRTEVRLGDRLDLHEPTMPLKHPRVVSCPDDEWPLGFCTAGVSCTPGVPVIQKNRDRIDILVGIGFKEHPHTCKPAETTRYHLINSYTEELCDKFHICRRATETIRLIPNHNDAKVYADVHDDYFDIEDEPRVGRAPKGHRRAAPIPVLFSFYTFLIGWK